MYAKGPHLRDNVAVNIVLDVERHVVGVDVVVVRANQVHSRIVICHTLRKQNAVQHTTRSAPNGTTVTKQQTKNTTCACRGLHGRMSLYLLRDAFSGLVATEHKRCSGFSVRYRGSVWHVHKKQIQRRGKEG